MAVSFSGPSFFLEMGASGVEALAHEFFPQISVSKTDDILKKDYRVHETELASMLDALQIFYHLIAFRNSMPVFGEA